jgi:hypothetical protein
VINNDLITNTDISTLALIYGEMKNRMYQVQCALDDGDGADSNYHYLEGLLDGYGFVYTEIDRVMHMRGEK